MSNKHSCPKRETLIERAPPASRASLSGKLEFSKWSVPVKAYSAIASTESLLKQVHRGCGQKTSQHTVCPDHGRLRKNQVGKAYAYGAGQLVEVTEDELSSIAPIDEKSIVIDRFFSPSQFDFTLLSGRSYYLAPANLVAQQPFRLFVAAMTRQQRWALATTVLSGKRHVVVIRPVHECLTLHVLHSPALLRASISVQNENNPTTSEFREIEKEMRKSNGPIEWNQYRDEGATKLAALVAGKIAAKDRTGNGKTKRTKRSRRRSSLARIA